MIAVFGAQGQVGGDLSRLLELNGRQFKAFTQEEADLTNLAALTSALEELNPTCVINAAAYTAVDLAEKEQNLAFKINGDAPGVMAHWCAGRNIPFVHYSTDYVFAGFGDRPWTETDPTGPINAYGKSKLAGELSVQKAGGKHLIFRTSWVYSPFGKNFLNTMLKLGSEREELKVISDQVGAPTLSLHLAQTTLKVLEKAAEMDSFPSGIFHACNLGETNWNEFAREIFKEARLRGMDLKVKTVHAIPTSEYPTPAKRPLNSRLSTLRLLDTFGVSLPQWQEGLKLCMELRK